MLSESRMLIDGELIEAASGKTFENINPATEEVMGVTSDAGIADAEAAVSAARRAFDETEWSRDHAFRGRCLEQLQAAFLSEIDDWRSLVVAETGCPVSLTVFAWLDLPVKWISYYAEMATSYRYETELPESAVYGANTKATRLREPAGVVTAITPFNLPVFINMGKIAPALAAGCAVVLKPSPDTPWTATVMGRLIAETTDIPPGIINIVPSSSLAVSEMLVTDPRVDMVSFTGSTATGRKIMSAGAETIKKVCLELGGKSANIVLDDADFASAAFSAPSLSCVFAGQGCTFYTRILLPRSRYDEGLAMLEQAMQSFPYGDPTDPGVLAGPVINGRQRDRVLDYIEKGKADGARVLVGGKAADRKGFFIEPTLFADVNPDSSIAQEEIFGPVLSAIPYDDEADAIRIANDSIYGLSGSVWSADPDRAMRVARKIRTGTLGINGAQWQDVGRPFGGYKQSGNGREWGPEGFEEYLETKCIAYPA
jgi:aldehyde dehydrogenase (NAD+)